MPQVNSGSTNTEPGSEDRQMDSKCPWPLQLDPMGMAALGLERGPACRLANSPT